MPKRPRTAGEKIKLGAALLLRRLRRAQGYGEYRIARFSARKRVVITDWHTEAGQKMLARARYRCAFFRLAHHYQAQLNPFYCGVACVATALNALRAEKQRIPSQKGFDFIFPGGRHVTYPLYSQLTVLNADTERIKRKCDIAPTLRAPGDDAPLDPGMTLEQVRKVLEYYGLRVLARHADMELADGLPLFIADLKNTLNRDDRLMILNYEGKVIGAATGGHFSLAAAYDEISESALVLDAAAHRNPWYWVPAKHLYHAMRTKDGEAWRGWLAVEEEG